MMTTIITIRKKTTRFEVTTHGQYSEYLSHDRCVGQLRNKRSWDNEPKRRFGRLAERYSRRSNLGQEQIDSKCHAASLATID
jgi:hypothetical protein